MEPRALAPFVLALPALLAAARPAGAQAPTPIAVGASVPGAISVEEEVDRYVFTAPAGQFVALERVAASDFTVLNWRLEDSYGRVLLDGGAAMEDEGPVALIGGDYEVVIQAEGDELPTYEFRVADANGVAAAIALEASVVGDIAETGQVDRYTFAAAPGTEVVIDRIAAGNANGLNLSLLDAHGRVLQPLTGSLEDSGPFGLVGGTYTVTVQGEYSVGKFQKSTYELRVHEVVVDAAQTSIGSTISGDVADPGDRDVWTFTATPGQRIFLDLVTSTASNSLNWRLEDEHGTAILPTTSTISDVGPFTLNGGTYTLTVLGEKSAGQLATGTYTAKIVEVVDVAANTAIGSTLSGAIAVPAQVDTYAFTAAAGQRLVIDQAATDNTFGLNLLLRDAHGREVVPRTTLLGDRGPIALMGGSYELDILGETGTIAQTGTYTVRLLAPTTDVAPIAFGTPTSGDVAEPGDEDLHTFTAAPGQLVQLDLVTSSNSAGLNWTLLDASGREVLPETTFLSDTAPIALVGGDYTVRVRGELASTITLQTGTYQFQVVDLGTTSWVPAGTPLALDTFTQADISTPGEVDDWLITVGAGENVYLDLLDGDASLRWSLFDPVGQPYFLSAPASSATQQNQGPLVLGAGDHVLRFEATGGATPDYQFEVVDVADVTQAYTVGAAVNGSIATPGAVHDYTFAAADGQTLYFDLQTAASSNQWLLVDPQGETVWGPAAASSTTIGDQGPLALAAGTYTLRVDPLGEVVPSYGFQVQDSVDVSTPIGLDQPVTASFATPGSTQRFTFAAAAGERIFADLRAGSNGVQWALYDPVGQPLFGPKAASSTTIGDAGPFELAGGAYTLEVSLPGAGTPSVDFTLHDVADLAVAAGLDTPLSGAVPHPGAVHAYSFTVASDGDRLYLDNQQGSGATWTLRDAEGEAVFAKSSLTLTSSGDEGPFGLTAGTYVLELETTASAGSPYAFEAVLVQDVEVPLTIDVQETGVVLNQGAEARFDFDVAAGQRLYFDSTAFGSGLTWSLRDEVGSSAGLFQSAQITTPSSSKQGPFDLAAGSYRLVVEGTDDDTPAYDFVVRNVDIDLLPRLVSADVTTFLSAQPAPQPFQVTWTVDNIGGGPSVASVPWTDRIVLSRNAVLGDADDVVLGEFVNQPPLAPKASYTRTETVAIPAGTVVGDHELFVAVDLDDDLLEYGGESNNDESTEVQVVVDVVPTAQCIAFDLADGATFPTGSLVALSGQASGLESLVDVTYVLDVSTSTQTVCGLDSNFDGFVDASDNLNGDTGASGQPPCSTGTILDSEIGASILLNSFLANNAATSHAGIVFSAQAAAMDLGPESFQQTWLAPFDRDQDGDMEPDFETAMRSIFSTGTAFCGIGTGVKEFTYIDVKCGTDFKAAVNETTAVLTNAPYADQRLVLFLTDGLPAPGGMPNPAEILALGDQGVDFKAFQLGAAAVTNELQQLVDDLDAHPDSEASATSVLDVNDLLFELVQSVQVIGINVNGVAADSVDASGQFFHLVELQSGPNVFTVTAFDAGGGTCTATITLHGKDPDDDTFQLLSDVTTSIDPTYSGTTYNLTTEILTFQATLENVDVFPVAGPLLMVIDNIPAQGVTVYDPDGFTPDGKPYFTFLGQSVASVLNPGDSSPTRPLRFHNPSQAPVTFDASYLAMGNNAPFFTSSPVSNAAADLPYLYDSAASDPDGHALVYSLVAGPAGMAVESATGEVTWLPSQADVGAHQVTIQAGDGWGGIAQQTFNLTIVDQLLNVPPVFASTPLSQVAVGAAYSYPVQAVDPDGDALAYALLAGPAGMTIAGDGLVTWAFALPGTYTVSLSADDGNGGVAKQTFVLTVGQPSTNPGSPVIFGSPSPFAVADRAYVYQPTATDPDLGDVLTFALTVAPAGMAVDPVTGLVTWTPTPAQIGVHPVELEVSDGGGGLATQAWDLSVFADLPNLPPVIESVPGLLAFTGTPYSYQVDASDPDGQPLTYDLIAPEPGMAIDAAGLLTWTPTATGGFTVAVQVTDTAGGTGNQVYQLVVAPPNGAPAIVSTPSTAAVAGGKYLYDVDAVDPDAHVLLYSLDVAPAGMTVNPATGLVQWTPGTADLGAHPVTVRAADAYLGVATQSWTVTVAADTSPPVVDVIFSVTPAEVNQTIQVCVVASDDGGIASLDLTADGVPLALDPFGCASFSSPTVGIVAFQATATDVGGNQTVDVENLQFVDLTNPTAPSVTLISPPAGASITAPVDLVADVTDDTPAVLQWRVELSRGDSDDFEVVASGVGETLGNPLALLDPTTLPNDTYVVRILGNDGVTEQGVEVMYSVTGNFKLGNWSTTFVDLASPVAGIPLVVTRTYHSLDTTEGDFGAGWRLGLSGDADDSAAEYENPATGLVALLGAEPFKVGTRVYATGPDGNRHGFTFKAASTGYPISLVFDTWLEADPGVTYDLEVVDLPSQAFSIGGNFFLVGVPYNPTTYRLTTPQGVAYTIHEEDGLQRVEDANGNSIDVTPGGLFSSTGVAMTFDRDAAGRITRITEPSEPGGPTPGFVEYDYDALGNLVEFRDLTGAPTTFSYDDPNHVHHLTEIEGPDGLAYASNVYDADGLLIGQCGPDGDPNTLAGCTTFAPNSVAGTQTIVDANGQRTDLFFDALGNVTIQREWRDAVSFIDIVRQYDANGFLVSETFPGVAPILYTYDADGLMLTRTDPSGNTTTYTYDSACGEVATRCDAEGNCSTYVYDGDCNLVQYTDQLGHSTYMTHDAYGNVLSLLDPVGRTWLWEYDAYGALERRLDPFGNEELYDFGVANELHSYVDRNGRRTEWTYDAAHRPLTETWDDGRVIQYGYDVTGKLTSASDPDSALVFDYWNSGVLRSVDSTASAGAVGAVVSYGLDDGTGNLLVGHDGNLNLTHVSDSFGGVTEYQYDFLDRLRTVLQYGAPAPGPAPAGRGPSGGASPFPAGTLGLIQGPGAPATAAGGGTSVQPKRFDTVWADAGLELEFHRYADLAGTQPVADTFLDYDCDGCPATLASIVHQRPDLSILHALTFERDALGVLSEVTDAEGLHTYLHDGSGRLVSADHPNGGPQPDESYAYDAAGNRTSSHLSSAYAYSYQTAGLGDRLVQDDAFDYQYDDAGHLTRRTDRSTGDSTTYAWDHRSRLTEVVDLDAASVELRRSEYVYDVANRMVRSDEDGVVRHYVYDGLNPILVLDELGNLLERRMYGRLPDEILAEEVGGATRWVLRDQVGTVRDLVDDQGQIVAHYVYDSFGRLVDQTGPAAGTGFQSRTGGAASGLLDFRARWYDPALGRFLSVDPVGPHQYVAFANSPLHFIDPLGTVEFLEYCFLLDVIGAAEFPVALAKAVHGLWENVVNGVLNPEGATPEGSQDAVDEFMSGLADAMGGLISPPGVGADGPIDLALDVASVACAAGDLAK